MYTSYTLYTCIYIYIYIYVYQRRFRPRPEARDPRGAGWLSQKRIRDNNLYTTTNKCLQCLLKLIYRVF